MKKQRLLVVCPGRGTYNSSELNYLQRFHPDKKALVESFDDYRQSQSQVTITSLDQAAKFDLKTHTAGDNASPLIFTCAWADFLSINRDRFEITAVTGNSMGWYVALACAEAPDELSTLKLINTIAV